MMRARVPSIPEFIESCKEIIETYDERVERGIEYEDQACYADHFRDELVEAINLLRGCQ
ncbi:MAG: hypothetical protein PHQ43_10215 [Dehalococcoidales bacterium]|nr:hypothetical protein [Dehalococcoidales bacterium]